MSSGTDALLVALMALGIGPGDEVITPTYSFFATAGCVSRLGATPVFVDIDPVTFNVDPAAVARAMTPRTRAILPVHLFGLSADMDPLARRSRARAGVPVIEDAAQAIGARYHGPAGRHARRRRLLLVLSVEESRRVRRRRPRRRPTTRRSRARCACCAITAPSRSTIHSRIGGNFRLDALQAAVLRVKAPHLAAWTEARRRNADRYRALFAEAGLDRRSLELPVEPPGYTHIYNQFVIRGAAARRAARRT